MACFHCGGKLLRISVGERAADGQTLALRACNGCGYWTRTILPREEAAGLLADYRERGTEVIDRREAA